MTRASSNSRRPLVRVLSPMRDFLATESSGAVLLALAALSALIWANSPWSAGYESLWSTKVGVSLGGRGIELDLRHWINDGLMTVFFLVVGLEIKREIVSGHLSTRRRALLPIVGAAGGIAVPALIYLAIAGGTASRGWAIPMATDIALAIGVLAVAGSRVPSSLRAFLLGLAIVDDIGAIVVIAAVYSSGVSWGWLALSIGALGVAITTRSFGVHAVGVYVVIGAVLWLALHEAGVHPTLAGVALGLLTPAVPRRSVNAVDIEELGELADGATLDAGHNSVSVVEWLEHRLHPWSSYVIVPVFALANAGLDISPDGLGDAARSPIAWGVLAGLLIGKPVGVLLASRIAVRVGAADTPTGASQAQMLGVGTAAGIGFTVAIFITDLAFIDAARRAEAKLAVLVASVLAAAVAAIMLRAAKPLAHAQRANR
jgi:Na+:H+ antiporter, NhaA family